MATSERQSNAPLIDRLFREFFGFSFFKAVHLLERLHPEKKPLGKAFSPAEEPLRFSVKPSLIFPPSDISSLKQEEDGSPIKMGVTFMGLIGPSGVLPHWYTELAMERIRQKDFSLTEFFDIFHHRLISLFYLAWKKHRFSLHYLPGAKDRYSGYLLGLMGLGTEGLTSKIGFSEEPLVFYSGLLSRPVPSVFAIEATVEYFSGTTAVVEQFINRVIPIEPEDQTQLGLANGQLGIDAVCGSHVWESQTKFRVDLGPMDFRRFVSFLPTGNKLRRIFALVRYMAGNEYEFEIGLVLKREEVPGCVLGMEGLESPRLGWTTWVKSPQLMEGRDPRVTFEEP